MDYELGVLLFSLLIIIIIIIIIIITIIIFKKWRIVAASVRTLEFVSPVFVFVKAGTVLIATLRDLVVVVIYLWICSPNSRHRTWHVHLPLSLAVPRSLPVPAILVHR